MTGDLSPAIRARLASLSPDRRAAFLERLSGAARSTTARRPSGESCDLVVPLRGGTRPPLFLLHPSGGSCAPYLPVVRHLAAEETCLGVDAVGLDGDDPLRTVREMTDCYTAAIRERQPGGSYRLAGWSTGGALAFAVAARLRADGQDVALLTMLDTSAPPLLAEPPRRADVLALFAEHFARGAGVQPPKLRPADLAAMPMSRQSDVVIRKLLEANAAPAELSGFVRRQLAIFEATVMAGAVWRPDTYDGRVDLICPRDGGRPDATVTAWSQWTTNRVVPHSVNGDHYTMMHPPNAALVAEVVQELLDRTRSG